MYCSVEEIDVCTSGSVVEYRLAKARVAGSNPVSCSYFLSKCLKQESFKHFCFLYLCCVIEARGDTPKCCLNIVEN